MDVFISPFFGDKNNSSTNNNAEKTTLPLEHYRVTSTIGQDLPLPGTAAATQIRIPAALPPRPAMDLSRPPKINTPTAAPKPARAEFPSSPDLVYEPTYTLKPPVAAPVPAPAADTATPASPVSPVLNMLWPFGGLGGTSSSSNSASASSNSRSSSSPALADFAGGGAGEGNPSDPSMEVLKQRYLAVYNERNELLAEKTARGGDIFAAPAPAPAPALSSSAFSSDPSSARKLRELEARAQKDERMIADLLAEKEYLHEVLKVTQGLAEGSQEVAAEKQARVDALEKQARMLEFRHQNEVSSLKAMLAKAEAEAEALREGMSGRNGRSDGAALEAENTRLRQTVMQLEQAVAKAKAEAAAASAAATAAAAAAAAATAKKTKTSEKGENDTSVLKTQLGLLKDRAATLEERSAADQAALKALQKESGAETQRLRAEVAEHQLRLTKANEVINMLKERAETLEARSSADAAALQALQRDNADAARARAEAESQKNAQKPSFLNKILRRGASEK